MNVAWAIDGTKQQLRSVQILGQLLRVAIWHAELMVAKLSEGEKHPVLKLLAPAISLHVSSTFLWIHIDGPISIYAFQTLFSLQSGSIFTRFYKHGMGQGACYKSSQLWALLGPRIQLARKLQRPGYQKKGHHLEKSPTRDIWKSHFEGQLWWLTINADTWQQYATIYSRCNAVFLRVAHGVSAYRGRCRFFSVYFRKKLKSKQLITLRFFSSVFCCVLSFNPPKPQPFKPGSRNTLLPWKFEDTFLVQCVNVNLNQRRQPHRIPSSHTSPNITTKVTTNHKKNHDNKHQ